MSLAMSLPIVLIDLYRSVTKNNKGTVNYNDQIIEQVHSANY